MKKCSSTLLLLAAIMLCLPLRLTEASTNLAAISASEKVRFDIPSHLSAGDDIIRKFQAVSSHGRSDVLKDATPVTYTIFQISLRAAFLMIVFTPMMCTSGLAFVFSGFRNGIWFQLLRFGISQGGAAFIKWAQWASTRPDIFPSELCSVLASLQSGAPEHSFSFTKRQIQKELGAPIDQIFEKFSKRPIASGSIAQVYKATLNGVNVAVKVRHPNVEEQIGIDFIIMKAVASVIERAPGCGWLKLSETMSQFSATIASQTDLGVEGRHLHLFNHYFKAWKSVSFPKPLILTNSVLVESFEVGDSVDKYSKTISCGTTASSSSSCTENNRRWSQNGFTDAEALSESIRQCNIAHFIVTAGEDTYLKMLLQDNLMHADLHPGNILIQQYYTDTKEVLAPKKKTSMADELTLGQLSASSSSHSSLSTRIVLVDAGMVARLLPTEQKNFIGLLEAMGEGRGDEAADYVMRFTSNPVYDRATRTAFRLDMKELFKKDCRGYGYNVNIGIALRGILNIIRIHQITIDANYATLVMNILCLDSMANLLLPSYNILDGAKPLLRFNRIFKRVPGSIFALKAAIPVAQWLKRKADNLFLRKLTAELKNVSTAK